MDSARLLVVDHSPECAEAINSLLRNSGIIVHTLFAQSDSEAEDVFNSVAPELLIYGAGAPEAAPVGKILQLARRHGVMVVVRLGPGDSALVDEALAVHSFLAVNNEDDEQLVTVVRNLLQSSQSQEDFGNIQLKLDELQDRYKLLLDSSRESIAYIHEGLHVYANRAYLELLQVESFSEIEATSLLDFMHSEKSTLKTLLRDMNKGAFPDDPVKVAIESSAGNSIEADLVFSPARYEGEDCIQMLVREADENATLKADLERLRRIDPVTGLANRQAFTQGLDQFVKTAEKHQVCSAVFYIEPDGTETLHAQLGVSGWDRFMNGAADVIHENIEEHDLAARLNDNGFAILVHRKNRAALRPVGEAIISSFGQHNIEIEGRPISFTCSAGMAMIGSQTASSDEALAHAFEAFLKASQQGNIMQRYKPAVGSDQADHDDHQWVERIRYALDNQDLYSVQQSIVNLEGDTEGLFENKTFMHEEERDISAEEFMPIAERNDLGTTIDRHIIGGLVSAIAGSGDCHIINVSTNSLLDFSFPSWFQHQLEEHGVLGTQIVLQLSAQAVKAHVKPATRMMDELKASGCSFSLSNFDHEKTTCELLNLLNFTLAKLKPGFSDGLSGNKDNQEIIRKVVKAAESARVNVIADDVQDAADLAVLWQCGVKLVAGDFLKEAPQVVG